MVVIIIAAVITVGIIGGFFWKAADIRRIKNLDYRIYSEYILRRTNAEPAAFLSAVKEQLKNNRIFVIKQYQVSPTQWEILGHPGRFWLTSEFISKVTVIDTVAIVDGSGRGPQRVLLAYLGSVETGSKEYMYLFFLILAITLAVIIRRQAVPHIFGDEADRQEKR